MKSIESSIQVFKFKYRVYKLVITHYTHIVNKSRDPIGSKNVYIKSATAVPRPLRWPPYCGGIRARIQRPSCMEPLDIAVTVRTGRHN